MINFKGAHFPKDVILYAVYFYGSCRKVFAVGWAGSRVVCAVFGFESQRLAVTIDFKGSHLPKSVILHAVFFYVRYAVSYRDLEEIMAERGVACYFDGLPRDLSSKTGD